MRPTPSPGTNQNMGDGALVWDKYHHDQNDAFCIYIGEREGEGGGVSLWK